MYLLILLSKAVPQSFVQRLSGIRLKSNLFMQNCLPYFAGPALLRYLKKVEPEAEAKLI